MIFGTDERVRIYQEIIKALEYLFTSPQYQEFGSGYLVEVFHEVMGDRPVLRVSRNAVMEAFIWNEPASQHLMVLFTPYDHYSHSLSLWRQTEYTFGPGVQVHKFDYGATMDVSWAVKEFLLYGRHPNQDSLVYRVPDEFSKPWVGVSGKAIQDYITNWGVNTVRTKHWSKPFELPDIVGEIY